MKAKTYYNRNKVMVLFLISEHLNDIENKDQELEFQHVLSLVKKRMQMSEKSLAIHLRDLHKEDNISIVGATTYEDLSEDSIIKSSIKETELGFSIFKYLKDIKFQNIYKGIKRKKDSDKVITKHTRTFYNRHSLFVLYSMFNNIIGEYKRSEGNGFDKFIGKEFSFEDISQLISYSNISLQMHLFYLCKKGLLDKNDDGELYTITKMGENLSRLLKDIKYQSIYNMNYIKIN